MGNEEARLPKGERAKAEIVRGIRAGEFGRPGDLFPPVRELGRRAHVSLKTAFRIVSALHGEGFLERRRNRYCLAERFPMPSVLRGNPVFGLVANNIGNPFFAELAEALGEAVRREGGELLTISSNYRAEQERSALKTLCRCGVAGIFACPWAIPENEKFYSELPVPFVLVGRAFRTMPADAVLVNDAQAAQSVAEHLFTQGYRRFAYIGPAGLARELRLNGFRAALFEHDCEVLDENILRLDSSAKEPVRELFDFVERLCRRGPVGIFCYHDLFALQVIKVAHRLGLAIPEMLGVVGFDDLSAAAEAFPPLSSVSYPTRNMADIAFAILKEKLSGNRRVHGTVGSINSHLIVRQSSRLQNPGKEISFALPEGWFDFRVM